VLAFGSWNVGVDAAGGFEVRLATQLYEGGTVSLRFEREGQTATRELARELGLLRIALGDVRLAPVEAR
jgi:hypothetical protein